MASGTITPEHTHKVMNYRPESKHDWVGPSAVSFHKSLKSASRAAEKRNMEYGAHRYGVERIDAQSHREDAKANLLREERLTDKYNHETALGNAAARMESGRTQEALGKLGAGKSYGQT